MADEVKENNKQLVCEIKIDAEMMRKIINEKITQIELDIQEIRAKTIDEFAERLKAEFPMVEDEYGATTNLILNEKIEQIAEQMKAGGKNDV